MPPGGELQKQIPALVHLQMFVIINVACGWLAVIGNGSDDGWLRLGHSLLGLVTPLLLNVTPPVFCGYEVPTSPRTYLLSGV